MRELLHEVADVVPRPDVVDQAWRRSVRMRRRRTAGTALLAAGSVVAVIGLVSFATDGDGTPGLPHPPSPVVAPAPPEAASPREPIAQVDGADAWLGPEVAEESALPRVDPGLPGTIDLTSVATINDSPGQSIAAFAPADEMMPDSILLLGADWRVSRLPLPDSLDLDPVRNYKGESVPLLNLGSLSPDGTRLVFPQPHGIVTYDLVTGRDKFCEVDDDVWTYYVGWAPDGTHVQLPNNSIDPDDGCQLSRGDTGDGDSSTVGADTDKIGRFTVDQAYFPMRSWGVRVQVAEAAWALKGGEVPSELAARELIAVDGPHPAVLALPETGEMRGVTPGVRVVTWLDRRTVAFESQAIGQFNVLGWDIKNGAVSLVSEIAVPDDWDAGVIASWSDL